MSNSIITYLCSSVSWGGLEMNQLKNAVWMRDSGEKVFVICRVNTPFHIAAIRENLDIHLIDQHRKYFDFTKGKALAKILNETRCTHLIIRDTRDMSVAVIAKRKSDMKIHLSYFMEMQLGVKKTNLFHTLRFSYLDIWSCPLEWLKKQVQTMTKFEQEKIKVIPSGIELHKFENTTSKNQSRELLELPVEAKIIGLVGRFDPHKGQLLLLKAMQYIKDKSIHVCLLGEPTKEQGSRYFESMLSAIEEGGLVNRVFIRPFRQDVETFYAAMDAFVMASKAETFGMVTVESLACGTPVIASNAGGSPEILQQGKFGLLFEPLDEMDLASKISDFFDNPDQFVKEELKGESKRYDHRQMIEKVKKELGI